VRARARPKDRQGSARIGKDPKTDIVPGHIQHPEDVGARSRENVWRPTTSQWIIIDRVKPA
jgi:hypothetical protein